MNKQTEPTVAWTFKLPNGKYYDFEGEYDDMREVLLYKTEEEILSDFRRYNCGNAYPIKVEIKEIGMVETEIIDTRFLDVLFSDAKDVHIKWGFDEWQANPIHKNWNLGGAKAEYHELKNRFYAENEQVKNKEIERRQLEEGLNAITINIMRCGGCGSIWYDDGYIPWCPHCRVAELQARIKESDEEIEAYQQSGDFKLDDDNQENARLRLALKESERKLTVLTEGVKRVTHLYANDLLTLEEVFAELRTLVARGKKEIKK